MNALQRLHQLIRERIGLVAAEDSLALERHMLERTRELGLADPMQFVRHLATEPLTSEDWSKLIAAATNPLTYFFRDHTQLQSAVAFLVQAARQRVGSKLTIWSAGCSTGEEPYTLAMLCHMHGLVSSILASDINPAALSEARRGVYARWALRHVEGPVAARFLVKNAAGDFAVIEEVRASVQFAEHNLTATVPLWPRETPAGWDLILCRNVLIYYPLAERRAIVERLTSTLRPGGVLFLGSSELVRDYERDVRTIVIAGRQALERVTARATHALPPPASAGAPNGSLRSTEPLSEPSAPPPPVHASLSDVQELVVAEIAENRLQGAITLLRDVVRCSSLDLAAHLSLGHLCVLTGQLEEAERCYEIAHQLDPLLHEAHLGLGVVALRRCDDERALKALQRAVFLEPRFWASAHLLGEVAERLKLPQIAAREFQRAQVLLRTTASRAPLVTHPIVHAGILPRLSAALERLHVWNSDA